MNRTLRKRQQTGLTAVEVLIAVMMVIVVIAIIAGVVVAIHFARKNW